MLNNNKGISLITTIMTIIVIIVLLSTITFTAVNNVKVKKLNDFYNDLREVTDCIQVYFAKHGKLPVTNECYKIVKNLTGGETIGYENGSRMEAFISIKAASLDFILQRGTTLEEGNLYNPNDYDNETNSVVYKVVDLSLLDNISLENTGKYLVNEHSKAVYYFDGVKIDDKTYHALPLKYTKIDSEAINKIIVDNIRIGTTSPVANEDLPLNSVETGNSLYIDFDHSISGGTTTVDKVLPFEVNENGVYNFVVTGSVDEKTYTKNISVIVNKYKVEPEGLVEYNISYTDMYYQEYNYTPLNGWRILDYTDNGDGTYSNIKIISTGIPALLQYTYNDAATSTWFETDEEKITGFRTILGNEDYKFYTGTNTYYGLQASAGLYYNFKNIKFAYGTTSKGNNTGYFTRIESNGRIFNSDNSITISAGELFNLYGTEKADVRLLTLPEINKLLGREDIDSIIAINSNDDLTGIFKLEELSEMFETAQFKYDKGSYYIASPDIVTDVLGKGIMTLKYSGEFSGDFLNSNGVRPVICINGNVKLYDQNVDGVLEIELQ